MVLTPLIKSASKVMLLSRLNFDSNNPRHQALYLQMKEEAVRAFEAQLKNRREMLKPAYANMGPPFAANHFTDAAFSGVIQSIWRNASPNTRPLYDQGAVANGDNWIILWMLYHACRYRDARNSKATSRNFHDDDDLDDNGGEGSSTTPHASQATRTSAYYDAARDGYRR